MKTKILLYDVAAEYGGALSVLKLFYQNAVEDIENEYIFVTSIVDLKERENIKTIKLPWVKKSWLHRLYCDWIYMPKLVKEKRVSKLISLQNIGIRSCGVYQAVYVHNAIPFSEYRFSLFWDSKLWLYQNLISHLMKESLRNVDEIIVQTTWMKNAVATKYGINEKKIFVQAVTVEVEGDKERVDVDKTIFFYPAQPFKFKNHQIIIDACKLLKEDGYEVILTLDEMEKRNSKLISQIRKYQLPIKCVGYLDKRRMYEYYKKSILVFPSYLETIGLPLLEAKEFDAEIIAADCNYSRNALEGYSKVSYFEYNDSHKLADLMMDKVGKE